MKTSFTVSDMNCGSCVAHIEKAVKKLPGVANVSVNFATGKCDVDRDPEKVTPTQIVEAIHKAGYTAVLQEMPHGSHATHEEGSDHDHAAAESEAIIVGKRNRVLFGVAMSALILLLTFGIDIRNEGTVMFFIVLGILIYTGREFYLRGIPALLRLRPDMDTLIALGVSAAFLYSGYNVFFTDSHEEYFMDAAIIATFIMIGRYLEARAKGSAGKAIRKLLELSAKVAHKLVGNKTHDIPIDEVVVGDLLLVKPGEKVPVDGEIIKGHATIDESMVTGESMPAEKQERSLVIGATINGTSSFTMRASKVGSETVLAQMIRLVEDAQTHKAPIQKLVDMISNYFVWGVIVIALATYFGWVFIAGASSAQALINTVTVLIIACPCALGLATPIAIVVGSGQGASLGILMKRPESLEKMHKITAICFDKTGTITEGKPRVTDYDEYAIPQEARGSMALQGLTQDDREGYTKKVLALLASLEHASEHPLAAAVIGYAQSRGAEIVEAHDVQSVTGRGVRGKVGAHSVVIGTREFLENEKVMRCAELDEHAEKFAKSGKTVLFASIDGKQRAIFAVRDEIKKSSALAIQLLKKRGIKTVMITGDNEHVAAAIAKEVGIDRVFAKISPEDKVNKIKQLQGDGEFVAMVGDGINDAPALATAQIGIAIGTGTDIAIESGDIVLVHGDLLKAVEAIELSRKTYRNIQQNLFWAFIYNSVGIPFAAFGFLTPIISSAAMAFSSVSVVLNALRLKRFKPATNK